jgi:long-chain acyl-CoA synthetase
MNATLAPGSPAASDHLPLPPLGPDLGTALDQALLAHATLPLLVEYDRQRLQHRWQGHRVRAEARRLCRLLQDDGVQPGDHVGLWMSNRNAWIVSAIAIWWAGGVLVPLDIKLAPADMVPLLDHARCRLLVTELSQWTLATRQGHLPALPVRLTDALPTPCPDHVRAWEETTDLPASRATRRGEDIAALVYTSGTGGTPRGCLISHSSYLWQARTLHGLFPFGPGDRFFSFLPTNHAIDLMCGFLIPILAGGQVIHQRVLRPELLGWTMREARPTHMAAVPRLLQAFRDQVQDALQQRPMWQQQAVASLQLATARWSDAGGHPMWMRPLLRPLLAGFGGSLRFLVAGGAWVDPALVRFFASLGLPVAVGWGQTEAGTVLTVNQAWPWQPDTAGTAVPGIDLRVRDPDAEGVGELEVRGPSLMAGYWRDADATDAVLQHGWLRTGDVGFQRPDGHWVLCGRRRDVLITSGGKNIYPETLEPTFAGLPGVTDHALMSASWLLTDVALGEDLLVLVVHGQALCLDTLRAAIRTAQQPLRDDRRVAALLVHPAPFPRTASMKVKRTVLADQIRARATRADLVLLHGGAS